MASPQALAVDLDVLLEEARQLRSLEQRPGVAGGRNTPRSNNVPIPAKSAPSSNSEYA